MKIPVTIEVDLDNLKNEVIGEAQEERIRQIVREEFSNLLPDIKRVLRQDVIQHLTSEIRKHTFVQSGGRAE